ncbi:hypothetical protein K2173_003988 [Erythroxylum novogranatense]|uniref:Mitochondrial import inner membrane translocase subunit TIM50 n=1 Tax=Erythroxylum novogranatense TaxID=1862640 RepID=A0AAV8SJG1_9ROSI|nr:hypothetical protein K2173_003988 [Erythroxylum novogranatense]
MDVQMLQLSLEPHTVCEHERKKQRKNACIDVEGNNPVEMTGSIEGDSCFETNVGLKLEADLPRVQFSELNCSKSLDTLENSKGSTEVNDSELVGNKLENVEVVQAVALSKVVEDLSIKKTSACCSNGESLNEERNKLVEIKNDNHQDIPINENMDVQMLQLSLEPHTVCERQRKNACIDVEGNNPVEMTGSIEGDSCFETNFGLKLEADLPRVQFSELNCSKSLDTLENSKGSTEVNDSKLVGNKLENVEVVQAVALSKVVEDLSIKKTSACCSNGESLNEERNKLVEIKNDNHQDVPIKENKDAQMLQLSLEPHNVCVKKKLLILDINGLLADIVAYAPGCYKADMIVSRKSVFKRPFCDDFLQFCFDKFNVGVWSSRAKRNVNLLIDFLLGDSKRNLLFCWDQSHCTKTGVTTVEDPSKPLVLKELKKLWDRCDPCLPWNVGDYNESNTLLLDDSPYKALRNPMYTGVFPHSYRYQEIRDSSLGPTGDLRMYLERLAEAPNVPDYVAQNPYGQRAITERNPSWSFYQRIINNTSRQS